MTLWFCTSRTSFYISSFTSRREVFLRFTFLWFIIVVFMLEMANCKYYYMSCHPHSRKHTLSDKSTNMRAWTITVIVLMVCILLGCSGQVLRFVWRAFLFPTHEYYANLDYIFDRHPFLADVPSCSFIYKGKFAYTSLGKTLWCKRHEEKESRIFNHV